METSLDLPRYKVGNYDDFEIDAYTVCERIMRVAAAKIPEQRDGFSEQINAIGMNVELAAVMSERMPPGRTAMSSLRSATADR